MARIKIKSGLRADLPDPLQPYEPAYCYDTNELFIADDGGYPTKINAANADYATNANVANISKGVYNWALNTNYNIDTIATILRAQNNLIGGGTVSFTSYSVKWTSRILAISEGRGSHFGSDGFFGLAMPAAGSYITKVGSAPVAVTTNGIPLNSWDSVWVTLPINGTSTLGAGNMFIYTYGTSYVIPTNAIKLCILNGDNLKLHLWNNVTIANNGSAVLS